MVNCTEEKFKEGTIEKFCHYLTKQREKKASEQNFKGAILLQVDVYLSKLLSRIVQTCWYIPPEAGSAFLYNEII